MPLCKSNVKRIKIGKEKKKHEIKNGNAYQADAQYTERKRLDLAVPRRPFPKMALGLKNVKTR